MPANKKDDRFEQYGFSSSKRKEEAPDFGGFLSGTPVRVEEEPEPDVTEEYIAPAGTPVEESDPRMNYMANMQNMFKSLSLDDTEVPEEEEPEPEEIPDPEPELSSFLFGKDGEIPVRTQSDLLTSESDPYTDTHSRFSLKAPRKKKGLQLNPTLLEQSKE